MLRWLWVGLCAPLGQGCALEQARAEGEYADIVMDERLEPVDEAMRPDELDRWREWADRSRWRGDTLTVDSRCIVLRDFRGQTLDQVCDVLFGGHAFVGEDRVAATVFDDAECEIAAGFLPEPGGDGQTLVPVGGSGLIVRCAILVEPR